MPQINGIRLNKSLIDSLGYPDVFDYDVLSHEYAHKLETDFVFLDSTSSTPHSWWISTSLTNAGCEGFAHFWSAYVPNYHIIRNTWGNFQKYLDRNIENGEYGRNDSIVGSSNDFGAGCEGSVAGILWDIYDSNDDDYTRWSGVPGVGQPDGVGDNMDDYLPEMIGCFLYKNFGGHNPDDMNEFWQTWFRPTSYAAHHDLWAVWYEHGVNKDIVKPTGTVTINGGADITSSLIVDLGLDFSDTLSGMVPPKSKMCFFNSIYGPYSTWEPYATTKINWDLS